MIEAKAHFDAPQRAVHVRVGGLDERLYLDLGEATWRAVEIDAAGWRVIDNLPVRFRGASGMKPLPVPVAGGSIQVLRSFLYVKTNTDFVLVVAWALAGPALIAVPIQSLCCLASRAQRSPPSAPSCARCLIRTPRRCGRCHARIATCSLLPAMVTCWPSTTCRFCPIPANRTAKREWCQMT